MKTITPKKFLKKYRYAIPNNLQICNINPGLVKYDFNFNLSLLQKFFE